MCGHLTLAAFEPGETVAALAQRGVLHAECARIFRRDKDENGLGPSIRLHHQQQGLRVLHVLQGPWLLPSLSHRRGRERAVRYHAPECGRK